MANVCKNWNIARALFELRILIKRVAIKLKRRFQINENLTNQGSRKYQAQKHRKHKFMHACKYVHINIDVYKLRRLGNLEARPPAQ